MILILGNDNNWYCPSILAYLYDYDTLTKKTKNFTIMSFLKEKNQTDTNNWKEEINLRKEELRPVREKCELEKEERKQSHENDK